MSTTTPNYNLIKPGVNDPTDQDLWGGYLNSDLDIIDAQMKENEDLAKGVTRSVSSSETLTTADRNATILVDATGGAVTITLPEASLASDAFKVTILKTDSSSNIVTIDANGSQVINGQLTQMLRFQYNQIALLTDGSEWFADFSMGNFFHIRDQKANGTAGGTFTTGAWRTRTLNTTVENTISGASLDAVANRFTLPAGSYRIEAHMNAEDVSKHKAKLYNITDSADVIIGTNARSSNIQSSDTSTSFIRGQFTITSPKVFEIQHRADSTGLFGSACSFDVPEVYLDALIWKI